MSKLWDSNMKLEIAVLCAFLGEGKSMSLTKHHTSLEFKIQISSLSFPAIPGFIWFSLVPTLQAWTIDLLPRKPFIWGAGTPRVDAWQDGHAQIGSGRVSFIDCRDYPINWALMLYTDTWNWLCVWHLTYFPIETTTSSPKPMKSLVIQLHLLEKNQASRINSYLWDPLGENKSPTPVTTVV